jgi:hypothetical protein
MAAIAPTSPGRPAQFATAASSGTQAAEAFTASRLTTTIALLAAVASAGGLFLPNLYRDNVFVVSAWKGTDLVTLFLVVPALAVSAALARHGSRRAQLVCLGLIDYTFYGYAYYLFGAAFNELFIVYTALFTLSLIALVYGLAHLDVEAISRQFASTTPVTWIAGYMLCVAAGLSVVYFTQIVSFIVTDELPPIVEMTGHPTSVVFALDLSLLVPPLILGACWLWMRRPWGYVLAAILNVKGAAYTGALTVAAIWAANAGVSEAAAEIPLWIGLTIGNAIAAALLFGHMKAVRLHW